MKLRLPEAMEAIGNEKGVHSIPLASVPLGNGSLLMGS